MTFSDSQTLLHTTLRSWYSKTSSRTIHLSVWRLFDFCGYLVWKWEDTCSGNIDTCVKWMLARGCRAILLFKNVTAFPLYLQLCALWSYIPGPPLVIWWMLWSQPTVAFLTWVVLLGIKPPTMAALMLSYWTTQSHNRKVTRSLVCTWQC